ncbi:MAG: 3'-5' exonuclease [Cryomorphaceae bacterium]|nr:3'-5' exonuclease [Cryomorphaceae bacterium]
MNFITIDFETATSARDSPCELGLTFVENNRITDVKSYLIKPLSYPYFDYFNIGIHGITPNDVKDAPEFDELWSEIRPMIEGQFLIAHNAGFDMSVLRKTLESYYLPFPEIEYACSYIFSKKIWLDLPRYDLKTLCTYNQIPFVHHRAGSDAEATAKLCLKAFEVAQIESKEDFPAKLRTTLGRLYEGGFKPSKTLPKRKKKE